MNLNLDIKTEDVKDVTNKFIDKVSGGMSWLVTRNTSKKIAVDEYVINI